MPRDTASEIVIAQQFCGPPNSGNGGYVGGTGGLIGYKSRRSDVRKAEA